MSAREKKVEAASKSEQRRLPRKDVLLSGILSDPNGQAMECVIRDMHAKGAAISIGKRLRLGNTVYLLDIGNQVAHLSRVVWSNEERSGLLFVQSYSMGLGLPPRLAFLWRLLFEAKMRQAETAITAGASAELALASIGVTHEYLHRMARHASADAKFQQLLVLAKRLLDM